MSAQLERFLDIQVAWANQGVFYDTSNLPTSAGFPGRCDPTHSGFCDCSGCQCAAAREAGVPLPKPCMTSGEMWEWCVRSGTTMPVSQAMRTRGAWLFVGFEGNEHVAVAWGDGRQFAAHSPSVGLGFAPVTADRWSGAARIPGMDYSNAPPPPPISGEEMAGALVGDKMQTKGPYAHRYPSVVSVVQPNGTTDLVGFNGAHIINGTDFLGMSVFALGHLAKPIVDVDSITGTSHFVFLASDGGTFDIEAVPIYTQ